MAFSLLKNGILFFLLLKRFSDGNLPLAKVKLIDNTLSWENVEQYISSKSGDKIRVPYEIGADILLKYSHTENPKQLLKLDS